MTFDQAEFDIRCEWGEHGVASLAPISDAVIIEDVMSYSTAVVIARLPGSPSPEAQVAVAAYRDAENDLVSTFASCASGKELIVMGFKDDIPPTAEVDVDDCVPILRNGAYVRAAWGDRNELV